MDKTAPKQAEFPGCPAAYKIGDCKFLMRQLRCGSCWWSSSLSGTYVGISVIYQISQIGK